MKTMENFDKKPLTSKQAASKNKGTTDKGISKKSLHKLLAKVSRPIKKSEKEKS